MTRGFGDHSFQTPPRPPLVDRRSSHNEAWEADLIVGVEVRTSCAVRVGGCRVGGEHSFLMGVVRPHV